MTKTKWATIRVPAELRDQIKRLAEEWDYTIWKVIELCVFSKAKRFGKGERPKTGFVPAVTSVILTPAEMQMSRKSQVKKTKKSQKEKADEGYRRRHSMEFLEYVCGKK